MRDSKEELKKLYVAGCERSHLYWENSGEAGDVEYYHDSMNVEPV